MSVLALPSNLPPGFRFHPTDEELISYFLRLKIMGKDSQVDHIAEVDFYKFEPSELPSKSRVKSYDKMWWFFCRRDYKYPSSARPNRKTKTGYWKITGQERKIIGRDGKTCIGKKKTLVFYEGRSPGKRTNWVMQEYYIEPDNHNPLPNQRAYVICRLKKKSDDKVETPNGDEGDTNGYFAPDFENQTAPFALPGVHGHPQQRPDDYVGQERSFHLTNGFSGDDNLMQPLWGADESKECLDEFVNSLIVDEDFYGETANNVFNISFVQEKSKRAYFGDGPVSSDTDAEGVNARYDQTRETSSMFGSPGGSKKVHHMRMEKTPGETLMTSAGQHSKLETVVPVPSQVSEEDASSDDSTDVVGMISCLTLAKEERPKSVAVSRGGHQRRIQAQKKVSPPALQDKKAGEGAKQKSSAAVDIAEKEKSSKESQNVKKMVQSSNVVEKHFKSASCESSHVSKWKSFFTFEETSSLSGRNPRPPSEHCFNAIVGIILFVVLVRELMLYGSW